MLALLKQIKREKQLNFGQTLSCAIIGLLLFCLTQPAVANFSINFAEVHLKDNLYLLNANLDYTLTDKAIEALNNGIALTLVLSLVIERERKYWWDETIAILNQRYQLKYHALTGQYVVKYLNTGIQETFPNLATALLTMGTLKNFPLLDKPLLHAPGTYWVYLQNYLDIESLPVPLRLLAYLSSPWRLSSEWYSCPLPPLQ